MRIQRDYQWSDVVINTINAGLWVFNVAMACFVSWYYLISATVIGVLGLAVWGMQLRRMQFEAFYHRLEARRAFAEAFERARDEQI